VLCRRLTLRPLLALGIACNVLAALGYLFSRSAGTALAIEGAAGLFVTLVELPLMDLAARATPKGSEGLGFALKMSVRNGALALSDIAGSWLIDQRHVSFFQLVWLNAGTTALVLLAVPFLPGALMDRSDTDPGGRAPTPRRADRRRRPGPAQACRRNRLFERRLRRRDSVLQERFRRGPPRPLRFPTGVGTSGRRPRPP